MRPEFLNEFDIIAARHGLIWNYQCQFKIICPLFQDTPKFSHQSLKLVAIGGGPQDDGLPGNLLQSLSHDRKMAVQQLVHLPRLIWLYNVCAILIQINIMQI